MAFLFYWGTIGDRQHAHNGVPLDRCLSDETYGTPVVYYMMSDLPQRKVGEQTVVFRLYAVKVPPSIYLDLWTAAENFRAQRNSGQR